MIHPRAIWISAASLLLTATTAFAQGSPAPCSEINAKARALVDAGRTEEARTFLTGAIQTCTGAESPSGKVGLAAALQTLGVIESTAQPREALQHFRRAMALDPDNMREGLRMSGACSSAWDSTPKRSTFWRRP